MEQAGSKSSAFLIAMFLLLAVASVITFTKQGAITGAATVSCDFTWPQVVVIDGTRYQCPSDTPYCYNPGASQGVSKCCQWSEQSGYDLGSCRSIGPSGQTRGGSSGQQEQAQQCTDTDNGPKPFQKGTTSGVNYNDPSRTHTLADQCISNNDLMEYYCGGREGDWRDIYVIEKQYPCEYGCENGACRSSPPAQCTETDTGRDYTKKGTTTGMNYNNPTQILSLTDFCVDSKTLKEYRCGGKEGDWRQIYVIEEDYVCPTTCSNGACGAVCTENDNGNDQTTLGSTIGPDANNPMQGIIAGTDRCESDGKLTEFYCENGMVKSATYGCAPGRYCKYVIERGMNGGKCVAQACTPGAKKCEGTALKTCKPDGSGWDAQMCEYGCDPAKTECKSSPPLCQDSDADSAHPDGKNSGLYGTISYPGHDPKEVEECILITPSGGSPDVTQCEKGSNCMVYELFCDSDHVQHQFMTCVYGCSGGACRPASNPLLGPCDDTDIDEAHPTGKNYEKKGQIFLNGSGDESDYCIYNSQTVSSTPVGDGWLTEFYCESGAKKNTVVKVPSGKKCSNGKFV